MSRLIVIVLALCLSACKQSNYDNWTEASAAKASKVQSSNPLSCYFSDDRSQAEVHWPAGKWDYTAFENAGGELFLVQLPRAEQIESPPRHLREQPTGMSRLNLALLQGFSAKQNRMTPIFTASGTYRLRIGFDVETDEPVWLASCAILYRAKTE